MKKILVSLALIGSAFVAGCSGSGGSSGNSGTNNCNADTDCPTGDVCNTAGHVCMVNCASGSSACPSSEMQCMPVPASAGNAGTAATTAVCQCATDALCGGGSTYCDQTTDFICEVTCSDNSGCQGYSDSTRVCTGGHCVIGVADAGPQGCNNPATPCSGDTICNAITGTCDPIPDAGTSSCGSDNTAGNCTAGQYCVSGGCQAPPACAAVTGGPTTATNSPIIWGVAPTGSARTDPNCNGSSNNVIQFQGYYLDQGTGTVATGTDTGATYKAVSWITASGGYGGSQMSGNSYDNTVVISNGIFTFELCSPSVGTQAGVVLADTGGDVSNVACFASY